MYDKMARDLNEHGAAFLKHGKTSQSLSLHDLFIVKDGVVTPNPKVRYIGGCVWCLVFGLLQVCDDLIPFFAAC